MERIPGTTKELILKESLLLFSEKGYEASSVSDLAGRLSMSKSALYKHYKNKRDIFDQILLLMEERQNSFVKEHSIYDESGMIDLKKVENYVFSLFQLWTEDTFCASFRKILTLEQFGDEEMADLYKKYLTEGPVFDLTEWFSFLGGTKAAAMGMAMYLYSPLYLYYSMYDSAQKKEIVTSAAKAHIHRFMMQLQI